MSRRLASALLWTSVVALAVTAGMTAGVIRAISEAIDESLADWDLENGWHDVLMDARGPR